METKTEKKPTKKVVDNTPIAEKGWEIKDRHYLLKGNLKPLTFRLRSKSSRRTPLLYFDEDKGYNRELRYASNQKSVFEIGRASCRERVQISVVAGSLKKKKENEGDIGRYRNRIAVVGARHSTDKLIQ